MGACPVYRSFFLKRTTASVPKTKRQCRLHSDGRPQRVQADPADHYAVQTIQKPPYRVEVGDQFPSMQRYPVVLGDP